jgi:hypothetical protein
MIVFFRELFLKNVYLPRRFLKENPRSIDIVIILQNLNFT